jgi:hypothetical protein
MLLMDAWAGVITVIAMPAHTSAAAKKFEDLIPFTSGLLELGWGS